jgi:hypothetical protein
MPVFISAGVHVPIWSDDSDDASVLVVRMLFELPLAVVPLYSWMVACAM